jgi:hypothetical protein
MSKLTKTFGALNRLKQSKADLTMTAAQKAEDAVRKAGHFYLRNREQLDTAAIAHTVTAAGLKAVGAKLVVGTVAVKAAPVLAAAAGVYFGKEAFDRTRDFMAKKPAQNGNVDEGQSAPVPSDPQ